MTSSVYEKLSELNDSSLGLLDVRDPERPFNRSKASYDLTSLGFLLFILGIALAYLLIYFIIQNKLIRFH